MAARRPRLPRPATALVVAVVLGAGYVTLAAGGEEELPAQATTVSDIPERPGADRASRQMDPDAPAVHADPTFAHVAGVRLLQPDARFAAFHEARHPEALRLEPVGALVENDNPDAFEPPDDRPGTPYRVLDSLGLPRAPTSAVDLVLEPGARVLAPVDGEVVGVREYATPAGGRDWRVVVEPEERPDVHVLVTHLDAPQVRVGATVQGGVTPLAAVRTLPFERPVEAKLGARVPHAHVEVKAAARPDPLDPNQPAVPAQG